MKLSKMINYFSGNNDSEVIMIIRESLESGDYSRLESTIERLSSNDFKELYPVIIEPLLNESGVGEPALSFRKKWIETILYWTDEEIKYLGDLLLSETALSMGDYKTAKKKAKKMPKNNIAWPFRETLLERIKSN